MEITNNMIGMICPHCNQPITVTQMLEFQKTLMLQMATAAGVDISEEELTKMSEDAMKFGGDKLKEQLKDVGLGDSAHKQD